MYIVIVTPLLFSSCLGNNVGPLASSILLRVKTRALNFSVDNIITKPNLVPAADIKWPLEDMYLGSPLHTRVGTVGNE
jgi:hypothetical protein